jgi:hypothetical protein
MMTMLWINVLLAVPFIALWAGIPMWLVLKRPDTRPKLAAAPAVRMLTKDPRCVTKTSTTVVSSKPTADDPAIAARKVR